MIAVTMIARCSALAVVLATCLGASASVFYTNQWTVVLPWSEPASSLGASTATFDTAVVAFAALSPAGWLLAATDTANSEPGRLVWATEFPLATTIPGPVVAAGGLAVFELDRRVYAVNPSNGSLVWNVSSPCLSSNPSTIISSRTSAGPVYMVCSEQSGDSSIVALQPDNGSTVWASSASSIEGTLAAVRSGVAAEGAFIYSTSTSNLTALASEDGRLLWRADVASVPNIQPGASVTHLALTGDVLLVRERSTGMNLATGPFSYMALQLNSSGGPPTLLWSAATSAQRDRLPPGFSEASPIAAPATADGEDVFYYWSATAPPAPPSPPPSSPPPMPPPQADIEPQWTPADIGASGNANSSATEALPASTLAAGGSGGAGISSSTPSAGGNPLAPAQPSSMTAASMKPRRLIEGTLSGTEGFISQPMLKARVATTGEELWSLALQPVSAPTASGSSVGVLTPEGLMVLDGTTGSLLWQVDQRPLAIYTHTPTLLAGGSTAVVRNCLNTLAPNSLCVYAQGAEGGREVGDGGRDAGAASIDGGGTSGTAPAAQAAAPALVLLLCALVPLLL